MPICVGNGKVRRTNAIYYFGGMGKKSPSTQRLQGGGRQGWQNKSSKIYIQIKALLSSLPFLVSTYLSLNTVNSLNFWDDC